MHEAVETVPVLAELGEQRVDLLVAADVAGKHQAGAEFRGEFGDAVLDALALVGEGQFGAFALACRSDAIGDGTVADQPVISKRFPARNPMMVSKS